MTKENILKIRQASFHRETTETDLVVTLKIEGNGIFDIRTGIGFFDHMLEQFSQHSLIDMQILVAKGDLHVDNHHTVEDCGIALGQALSKSLKDRRGITRYASIDLVMDECSTHAAVDVSGRPFLFWQIPFSVSKIGTFDTELVQEFFRAFAQNAGITLHIINNYGTNNHHIVETCFKAVARVLRTALAIDSQQKNNVPSTKGCLGA